MFVGSCGLCTGHSVVWMLYGVSFLFIDDCFLILVARVLFRVSGILCVVVSSRLLCIVIGFVRCGWLIMSCVWCMVSCVLRMVVCVW